MPSRRSFVRWCVVVVCMCAAAQLTGVRQLTSVFTRSFGRATTKAAFDDRPPRPRGTNSNTTSRRFPSMDEMWNLPTSERLSRPDLLRAMPEYLREYIAFHRERVWTKPNGKVRLVHNETPFLVYGCNQGNCGGIADRLNGILTMLHVAICTKRVFIINMDFPLNLTEFLQPNLIQWNVVKYAKKLKGFHTARDSSVPESYLRDPERYLPSNITNIRMRPNVWLGNHERGYANYSACMRQRPPEQPFDDFDGSHANEMYRWGFWALFKFHDDVLDRATELKLHAGLSHLVNASNVQGERVENERVEIEETSSTAVVLHDPYIGVHVRTGTGFLAGRPDPERHGPAEWQLFLRCAQRFQKFLVAQQTDQWQSQPLLYVASDYDQVKEYFVEEDSQSVRVGEDVDSFHVDRSDPHAVSDVKKHLLDVWAEFVMLIDATCLVRSRSGFSEVPTILGASTPASRYRCGVMYNQCDNDDVELATKNMVYVGPNEKTR